jgi:hypothetical protein
VSWWRFFLVSSAQVPVTILPRQQIQRVHAAAVAAQLTSSRAALLGGIDLAFVDSLTICTNPSSQILSDLHGLNAAEQLSDGAVPLRIWLENALALAGQRVEADVFLSALTATDALSLRGTVAIQVRPGLMPRSRRQLIVGAILGALAATVASALMMARRHEPIVPTAPVAPTSDGAAAGSAAIEPKRTDLLPAKDASSPPPPLESASTEPPKPSASASKTPPQRGTTFHERF